MKVNIFPLVSSLHNQNKINKATQKLLNELMSISNIDFKISTIEEVYDCDLSLILIQSGGSEGLFLENFSKLKGPFYLLTYGNNNSLAASLEILSYLKDNNLDGEVLHGTNEYIIKRIKEIANSNIKYRFGVIGKPSDWLIASNVNYQTAKRLHNVELVDISIDKVCDCYKESDSDKKLRFNYDENEILSGSYGEKTEDGKRTVFLEKFESVATDLALTYDEEDAMPSAPTQYTTVDQITEEKLKAWISVFD